MLDVFNTFLKREKLARAVVDLYLRLPRDEPSLFAPMLTVIVDKSFRFLHKLAELCDAVNRKIFERSTKRCSTLVEMDDVARYLTRNQQHLLGL